MGNQADISRATELLSLENSSLCVRGSSQVLLEIPELRICSGERLVVTGPSGSGKSPLLSMITGRWAAQLDYAGTRSIGCERIGYIPRPRPRCFASADAAGPPAAQGQRPRRPGS
ncbi:ATP-binding cassette domain-containing protein [Glutamicibacter halophytocola]|uniref:ATP-binding cassette domain-containing protein n=1 Tax=Glutamicibacter halophytocola TaxID=1933880 RepID=UPI00321BD623